MNFVRYDPEDGRIVSVGQMPEAGIDSLNENGDHLIKTGYRLYELEGWRVDLETLEIVPDTTPPDSVPELKAAIRSELMRTDYTQAADAEDHLSPEEQAAWRDYRRALRDAYNKPTEAEMIAALPRQDAKGVNSFARFSDLPPTPPPLIG